MSTLYYESELYHHGILGMKWGVRRYQNPDGSLTAVGRRRYGVNVKKAEKDLEDARRRYRESSYEESQKTFTGLNRAKEDLKNEKIKEKLNSETKISKHRLQLEEHYRQKGMTEEEAAIAAYKRARAEKIFAATLGVAAATAIAYGAYKYHEFSVDKIIDPKTTLARVATDKSEEVHEAFYAVRDSSKGDKDKYVGMYAKQLSDSGRAPFGVFQKKLNFGKSVKIASEKHATEALRELVSADKKYASALSAQLDEWRIAGGGTPKQQAVIRKAGEALKKGKVNKSVYDAANLMLADHQAETTQKFYDILKKKGYGAIKDVNDHKLSGYGTKEPLIVFGQAANTTLSSVRRLGKEEMDKAYNKEYNKAVGKILAKQFLPQIMAPIGAYAAGSVASNVIKSKANDKIVSEYRRKHPDTEMSYTEIVRMYEDKQK